MSLFDGPQGVTMWALRGGLIVIAVVAWVALAPRAPLWGDGPEYAATLVAWINHASPDLRSADLAAVASPFARSGHDGLHPNMIVAASDGTRYAAHFWLYALVCVPAALVCRLVGADPLAAFPITNALLLAAFGGAARWSRRLTQRDRDLILLAGVTPVVPYAAFAHPEVFTWACVLAALLAINHGRYAMAALFAALGAMQNPPVASLSACAVILALGNGGWRPTLVAAGAAAFALLPPLFYFRAIGRLAPLNLPGFFDWRLATPARAWSMLTDLDQGLLPYVPGLLVLAALNPLRSALVGGARAVVPRRRERRHPHPGHDSACPSREGQQTSVYSYWRLRARTLGIVAVLLLFIGGAATSNNWNSALCGLMRYAVWVMPLLAWLATEAPIARRSLTLVLAVHAVLMLTPAPAQDTHSFLARWALTRWPSWYYSDPEIFAERGIAVDWAWRARLPIAFVRDDGSVAKLLTDRHGLEQLEQRFVVDAGYRTAVATQYSATTGLFFLAPPGAVVRSRCTGAARSDATILTRIQVRAAWPATVAMRRLIIPVEIANTSDRPLCNLGSGAIAPFSIGYRISIDDRVVPDDGERTRGPQMLVPHNPLRQDVSVVLPDRDGRYVVDVLPLIEGIAWGEHGTRAVVEVHTPEHGAYGATVTLQSQPSGL